MQLALLCLAIFFVVVKGVSTIWLVRQQDATTVTNNPRGRVIYCASKFSVILFFVTMIVRAWLQGAPPVTTTIWVIGLIVSVVMVVKVMRQRASGEWYGYAHALKERRRRSDS